MTEEKDKLLTIQIIASIVFIITTIISIILIYNEKLDLEEKETLFSKKITQKISISNRTTILVLTLIFLYANYRNDIIARIEQTNIEYFDMNVIASLFNLVAAVIALYIVLDNTNIESVSEVENPII